MNLRLYIPGDHTSCLLCLLPYRLIGPLSYRLAPVEKIGQRRFRTGLILVAEQATASGYVADPGLGPL